MRVTQRARNSRSCETRTTPPRRPCTKASRRSRPARSRSLVGSSRRTTSKRLSSSAASAARAAWPPERQVIRASGPTSRPRSASIGAIRSSRSAAPLAIQRSKATAYSSSAPGRSRPERLGGRLHRGGGAGRAGAAADVRRHGLAGDPLVLLRQPADERVRRRGRHGAVVRLEVAGQDPQQRGLAGAVGADDPDDVAGRDGEVEALEEGAVAVAPGEVLGDEGCAHVLIVVSAAASSSPSG